MQMLTEDKVQFKKISVTLVINAYKTYLINVHKIYIIIYNMINSILIFINMITYFNIKWIRVL